MYFIYLMEYDLKRFHHKNKIMKWITYNYIPSTDREIFECNLYSN